ncbi:hypothetical protein SDC9_141456 [bioreactor metagenome]|uniref:Uncharacterized protein n=1 Tax=bioreactor metagenome TaxID=1076179 RepID=A0A645DXR7_9ZZZZ|nr:DUF6483 family protein [Oscillospiraceae bacterium]
MYYEKDWVLRQINIIIQFVAKLVYKIDDIEYSPSGMPGLVSDKIYEKIKKLIGENKLNEAENELFEAMEARDGSFLLVALDFYQTLNRMTDKELVQCGFSRSEILDGLITVLNHLGVPYYSY